MSYINKYVLRQNARKSLNLDKEINTNDERLCSCGDCKYCNAYLSSDDDYKGRDYLCGSCGGGGCAKCE